MVTSETVSLPSIPQPLRWEGRVQVQLPEPIVQLAADLHADRQWIGIAAACLAALVVFGVVVRRREGK